MKSTLMNVQLLILKRNFNDLKSRDTIANDIATMVETKQATVRGKDGISESNARKVLTRSARFIMSTKDLAMGLARLDHHGIAPIVLGGVYTVVGIIQNDSDEHRAALTLTLDIAEIVALWNSIEKYQISKNLNPNLKDLYEKLSHAITSLYQEIIVLLGTMMAYFDKSRWGKCSKGSPASFALIDLQIDLQVDFLQQSFPLIKIGQDCKAR